MGEMESELFLICEILSVLHEVRLHTHKEEVFLLKPIFAPSVRKLQLQEDVNIKLCFKKTTSTAALPLSH